jgi:acyl-CoA synthetase (NDP forming)
VLSLARAVRYARWRSAPLGELRLPEGIDRVGARELVEKCCGEAILHQGLHALSDSESTELLRHYGIPVVEFEVAGSGDDAIAAARRLGYPVVLKSPAEELRDRTDLVGVRLDLGTDDAVRDAYAELRELSESDEVVVQRMVRRGVSCVVGVQDDPSFGSLVYFGLSGFVGELLGDRAYRAVPLTDSDAAGLVRAPRAAPLLAGYRGAEPADLDALADLMSRVSALAEDLPEIHALALDPVLASAAGVAVTSARITVGSKPRRVDDAPRQLRSVSL